MPGYQPVDVGSSKSVDQATAATSAGHVTAVVVNAAMLWAIHMWPGWQTVPFLTPDTSRVLSVVTLVLVATMLAHLVFLVVPSRMVNALGNLAVLAIGVPAMVQLWEVFPFDFSGTWSGWPVVVRTLLVLGIVGQVIGFIVGLVALFRAVAGFGADRRAD